ncbi:signal recognition particle protein [Neorickettsia helminthoeca str. Oregon]|uniref:signal-recognition-particle GTPase n=1 Tax=Neorickettsia helminthoeca str. Oregon TaxID=1286528 RepID=X5HLZ8_9RICK|nr:signal recognition particle protein [Neorickettsia helminthoeca]AHX11460.1 signal recognition particle protein [Neorickettsia helminthoeca str. Oregon]
MFGSLSRKISGALDGIKSKGIVTEKDFDNFVRKLRLSLLEADVPVSVTKEFISNVKEEVVGKSLRRGVSQSVTISNVIKDELIKILGGTVSKFELPKDGKSILMLVGLQGVGKTTTAAKLALFMRKKFKKKNILLSSIDVYRPAARKQLEILARQIDVASVPIVEDDDVRMILDRTMNMFDDSYDVLILDTAGRSQIDLELMNELKLVKQDLQPCEILQVVDSMMGQDSLNVAKTFKDEIGTTGVIVSRVDSDTRGGAMLSIKHCTGLPIKFCGAGEKVNDLEEFHPDRIAGRILGMGDVESLMEYASSEMGEEKVDSLKKKIESGKFDYDDLVMQFKTIDKLGGIAKLLKFIPGINKIPMEQLTNDTVLKRNLAIIKSMTKRERKCVDVINQSRKLRIAAGAGVKTVDVNKLMRNFEQARALAVKFGKSSTKKKILETEDLGTLFKK